MTINVKYTLSGLTKDQFNNPAVQRIIETLVRDFENTGNGLGLIRWIEETYQVSLIA